MSAAERLDEVLSELLIEYYAGDVLAALAGQFVGLTVELARRNGADTSKAITVEGGSRVLTIGPPGETK